MNIDISDYYNLAKVLTTDKSGNYALVGARGELTGRKPVFSVWKIKNPHLKPRIANLTEMVESWTTEINHAVFHAHRNGIEFYDGQTGFNAHRPKDWTAFSGPDGFAAKYRMYLNQHPEVNKHRTKGLVGRPSGSRSTPVHVKRGMTAGRPTDEVMVVDQGEYRIMDWVDTGQRTMADAKKLYPDHVRKVDTRTEVPSWGTGWYKEVDGFLKMVADDFDSTGG